MKFISVQKCENLIMSYPEHSHAYWEIVLQVQGVVESFVGKEFLKMSKGDILIIPPNTAHTGVSRDGYLDAYLCVDEMDFNGITLLHDKNDVVKNLMNMLYKTYIERNNNYKQICNSLANTIAEYLKSFSESREKYDFVSRMKGIIYENTHNPDFKITAEIKKLGYNVDYFRRCFFEDAGKTPLEYLTELRINKAKNLFNQKYFISVADVAAQCGFSDQFYFSKKFKSYTGVSPTEYKKTL